MLYYCATIVFLQLIKYILNTLYDNINTLHYYIYIYIYKYISYDQYLYIYMKLIILIVNY